MENYCKYRSIKYLNNSDIDNRLKHLYKGVCYLLGNSGGGIQSIVAGTNISVDATDPQNPIVSANSYDSTVDFSVNANPNTGGTTFSPNTPNLTTVIYVSTIDGSQWTSNGTTYTLYVAPYWSKNGNSGITASNFIGTTNNATLFFKVNNILSGQIASGSATSFGYQAMLNNIGGSNNAFGWNALATNTTGIYNNAFGTAALQLNTGNLNSAFGDRALSKNSAGLGNTGIGSSALRNNTTGSNNVALGAAMISMITGDRNISIGFNSMQLSTVGNDNVAIGQGALTNNTGSNNIALGNQAGYWNTTGSDQIFIGSLGTGVILSYSDEQTKRPIYIQQNATVASQLISLNGKVGIQTIAPTAKIHIAAGTATANTAPIKFTSTSSALLTTPELGALEFFDDGTTGKLYITVNVAGVVTRKEIAFV